MTNENGLPERIWVCTHLGEYGHYYPEAVEAEGEWGGVAIPYVPEAISDAKDERIEELETKLHIYEGRNGQPVSSTGIIDEMADALKQKDKRIAELEATLQLERQSPWVVTDSEMKRRAETAEAKLAKAIGALTSIEKWAGEFPPTNKFWPHGKPMSYVAAYGSNGERDFMREKARKTIAKIQGNP